MTGTKAYLNHLSSSDDLVTTAESRRNGFKTLVRKRNELASQYVKEARKLKEAAEAAASPEALRGIPEFEQWLITAAGLSSKTSNHFLDEDKKAAIDELISDILVPAKDKFVEELVYRYLLTCGDKVGGSMRNIAGVLSKVRVTQALVSALEASDAIWRLDRKSKNWQEVGNPCLPGDFDAPLRGLSWIRQGVARSLLFDIEVPLVGNNVDICLLSAGVDEHIDSMIARPGLYIALGELKGGIDPAGADEHWKTASKAFDRIRNAFSKQGYSPSLFFLGAAIEKRMASEIWDQLESGMLANAANLTADTQLDSICRWLVGL